jgi:endonuclease/exonuclease/phosphatase (EEP) superfamily protein YafD
MIPIAQTELDMSWKRQIAGLGQKVFWGLTGFLLVFLLEFVLIRLFLSDRTLVFVWANMFTPYLYLPVYGILLLGLWKRQWLITAVSAGIVAFHLYWVMMALLPGDVPAPAPGATPLRLFSANLLFANRETEAMIAEISAADPDVLVFQEYTSWWHEALLTSELAERYPYRVTEIRDSPFGAATWAKRPFAEQAVWFVEFVPVIEVVLEWDGQPVRIFNLHPPPPLDTTNYWNQIIGDMLTNVTAVEGPTIVAGDFNFTPYNNWYHQFQAHGLRNAHQSMGRGWATTFPNGTSSMPPVRIDHLFLSREIAGLAITEGIGFGSDHRPVLIDVALAAD